MYKIFPERMPPIPEYIPPTEEESLWFEGDVVNVW
jgi:hypothetical protein